ncbi:MAG: helix-turn-helix transcriptional regulator [Gammaproteobacteria bacterium]|nr:helix-turn-helix transcriptional regulator [Gammaproteobacteria bacterium]
MRHANYECNFGCPVEAALEAIGGKWKGLILFHLLGGVKRFSELQKLLPDVTQRMLTRQLRELEADQIVLRTVYPEVPPRVEYALTEFGETLGPILFALQTWGNQYLDQLTDIRRHAVVADTATVD